MTLTSEQIESFLARFFGPGNSVSLDEDPNTPLGQWLVPLLQVARQPSDVPVVLPRRKEERPDQRLAYAIAWDRAHATMVAELLTAFVGPTYSYFNGLPATLDPADTVEKAILDLVGPDTTFILRSPTRDHEAAAWRALGQMQRVTSRRPVRNWSLPKPVGRLLGEFEVALAAGDNSASAAVLDQLAATGGLGGANLNNLRIKRLARLGRNQEMLALPALSDVAASDPPTPVRDAILAALYQHSIVDALENNDLEAARTRLEVGGAAIPSNLQDSLADLSTDALWIVLLAAHLRDDRPALERLLDETDLRPRLNQHPDVVAAIAANYMQAQPEVSQPPLSAVEQEIESWVALARAHVTGESAAAAALRQEAWREWAKPHNVDQELAAAISNIDNQQAERVWQLLGPFLDADDYGHPAPRTAARFLQLALGYSWFSPADLAGIVALTETILRSSPHRAAYGAVLDDLSADTEQWVSPDRATVALDLADLLVRMPCPDEEARLRLAECLLSPLAVHSTRLDDELRSFAQQLDSELGTGLTWRQPDADSQPTQGQRLADLPQLRIMLYSLDEGVLARTSAVLAERVPQLKIHLASDRVGSTQLKQHSQHADVIILATRCATHAATGAIRSSAAPHAIVHEADGSGSASLLRAATAALQTKLAIDYS